MAVDTELCVPQALVELLLSRGLLGLAWAGPDLRVVGTTGRLADWMSPGQHLCNDVTPFLGLEDDLNTLMDDFHPSLALPKVGLPFGNEDLEKSSIEVFWAETIGHFVVLLHQLGAQPEFEVELARQMRARRLAEENLANMQREARANQSLVDIMIESAPTALAIFDAETRYVLATRKWLELLGLESQTLIGRRRNDIGVGPAPDEATAFERAITENGSLGTRDITVGGRVLQMTSAPWRDEANQAGGLIVTAEDVTSRQRKDVETARTVADRNRMIEDLESFAGVVAHDLKAPLSAARYSILASRSATEDAERTKTATEAERSLNRAFEIIDGLLAYNAHSGLAGPEQSIELRGLVSRIVADATCGTTMTAEITGDWPTLTTAVAPLDLILRNLIQNAVKHHDTSEGRIRVWVEDAGCFWHFSVEDDGRGIAPEHREDIFQPLLTLGGDESEPSTGLGLAFVRRAAESVGGTVQLVANADGKPGATFRVCWPKIIERDGE